MLSGAVLTEQVFTIPGFGKLIVDAVFNRDYAVVQGVVLCTAAAYISNRGKSRGGYAVAQRCLMICGRAGTSGWFGTWSRDPR